MLALCVLILNHNWSWTIILALLYVIPVFFVFSNSSTIASPTLTFFFCLQWGLLKLHSWFPFEVGPLCVLICGSIARYVVDSLFYSLWLHLFCVVLSVFLPLSVWRPRHSLRDRHVRRTLARTLAPMVVHWLIVVMDNIGRYVHHIFLWLAKNLRHHKCSVECFFSWTITMFN